MFFIFFILKFRDQQKALIIFDGKYKN